MSGEFDQDPAVREADLLWRAQLASHVFGIAMAGMWDAGGSTKEQIKLLGLDAANDSRLQVTVDESGAPTYSAWLTNMEVPSTDLRRGRIQLGYQGEPLAFNGIDVDVQAFGGGRYHLYPDGKLTARTDNRETVLSAVRARLLFRTVRGLCVTFTDPELIRHAGL